MNIIVFFFYLLSLDSYVIHMQEIYNRDDVHEMLENSASGVHMFNCILQ